MTDSKPPNTDNWHPIGTVEVLVTRCYPIDPTAEHPGRTTVLVPVGAYPVMRKADAFRWVMRGRINEQIGKIGDGLYALHDGDVPSGPEVQFSSPVFGAEAFREFLTEPIVQPGPVQRLRFDLPAGVA